MMRGCGLVSLVGCCRRLLASLRNAAVYLSQFTAAGVSPGPSINVPSGVVVSAARIDLLCGLQSSWRSSRVPASLGSYRSSFPYSATAWMHATWTARTVFGTTPYVVLRVWNRASAALVFFMRQLWCSLGVRAASIETQSHRIACLLNCMNPSPTLIIAVSFGRICLLWPHLPVNSATSHFAVSNCSRRLPAHSKIFATHLSSMMTGWLTLLPVATQPTSYTKDSPFACDTYSSTHLISPVV